MTENCLVCFIQEIEDVRSPVWNFMRRRRIDPFGSRPALIEFKDKYILVNPSKLVHCRLYSSKLASELYACPDYPFLKTRFRTKSCDDFLYNPVITPSSIFFSLDSFIFCIARDLSIGLVWFGCAFKHINSCGLCDAKYYIYNNNNDK